jgi:hypothetical protein
MKLELIDHTDEIIQVIRLVSKYTLTLEQEESINKVKL